MSTQTELSPPPTDAISAVHFSTLPASTKLLVAAWDRNVYLYDFAINGGNTDEENRGGQLLGKFEHRAPVLDVCFGDDEEVAFSGGVDCDVRRINLLTGDQTVLSTHKAGVRSVVYDASHKILISASWDSTLHIHHDPTNSSSSSPYSTITLPAKPFSLSASPTKLVVAMASRAVHIYQLDALSSLSPDSSDTIEPWQRRESSLKFMTRAVACMPSDLGYASSSIEGRVAVEWFDPSPESQARKYAFKCHRQASTTSDPNVQEQQEPIDIVYPVNTLAFHPVHGSFASGGGDGIVALWDANAKRRIRQYQKYPASVAALAFSANGKYLAVAVCPGFEDGEGEVIGQGDVRVYVRELGEGEAKGKGSRS